jgi:hypothetical protein
MVLPLLPIALALTAAGMGANYVGAKKADNAVGSRIAAERHRQNTLDEEAFALNDKSRDRYEDIAPQQDAKAADLAEMFLSAGDDAPSFGPEASDDNITVRAENKAKAKSKAYTDQQGTARAQMMSLGDLFGDIGVDQARDMSALNGVMGFKRGSQGVLPMELDAAQGEGSGWRLAGDVLGGLGSVASMGAMTGAAMPGMGIFNKLGWGAKAAAPGAGAVNGTSKFMPLQSLY